MKKIVNCLIFIILISSFLSTSYAGQLTESFVIKESKDELKLSLLQSTLIIDKYGWGFHLIGYDGVNCTSCVIPPSFKVGEKWVSVEKFFNSELQEDGSVTVDVSLSNGEKGIVRISPSKECGYRIQIEYNSSNIQAIRGTFFLANIEEIYGFGEMWNGHVAQRGQSFDLWDKSGTPDECAYMPYYVSTNNYAFFLNYGGKVSFDVGQSNSSKLIFEAPVSKFDFTLVTGKSIANTVQNYLNITGMPARPPRWAFEPWFWLMSDPNKPGADINTLKGEHFPQMIKKLKELNFPIGVTWFEPPWQDARTSFAPNKEFSPDLKGLINEINKLGVKTLAWSVPYTTNMASNWKEAVEKGYLVCKPSGAKNDDKIIVNSTGELEGNFYTAIDYFNPEAATWWQNQIEKSIDLGLKGYKPDAGQDMPDDAVLYQGLIGKDIHNSYALEYNKVYFNALKNKLGDDFLLIPRAAWIGSAAYTNFKWPGDLSGDFANNGLPSSVHSSMSLALSGMPFVSSDIGGFVDRPAPENVWIRWAQFGAFLPGMQTLHMPWWYSEKALNHYRYLSWLHTDLIPFWETLSFDAHTTGTPLIRPLVWDYQSDVKCWRIDDEFTVGNAFLVAPILNSNPDRDVYIPEGTWFDFWDEHQTITGPQKIHWSKSRNDGIYKFPVFIREGSVIPMEISNNVTGFGDESSKGYITLAVWPKANDTTEFKLQDKEETVLLKVDCLTKNKINISWGKTGKKYLFRIHLAKEQLPTAVSFGEGINLPTKYNSLESFRSNNKEGWFFDSTTENVWVRKLNIGKSNYLEISVE